MKKSYLISYFHWTNGEVSGFGNAYVREENDIYTEEFIKDIEKTLIKRNSFTGVAIQNIIPLND